MAVRCPQCLGVSGDDDASCAWCGQNLYDQVVVFVDEPIVPTPRAGTRPRWVGAESSADDDDARDLRTARSLVSASSTARLGHADRDPVPTMSATLVVSRVIGLSGPASEAALDCWWQGHQPHPGVEAGRVQLTLRELIHQPDDGCLCHATARWSHRLAWRSEPMEIELLPWSARSSELTLRPVRYRANRSDNYFRTAYALLEVIAGELDRTVSGP
ncbi:MAG: hypothetical protein NVS3B21_23580 [Acidimicrobiales bacterium]